MTTSVSLIHDYDDECPTINIQIVYGPLKVRVDFSDPSSISFDEWKRFISLVHSNGSGEVVFCDSNGYVGLETKGGVTTMSVSRYGAGAGGDGAIEVEIINSLIYPVLLEACIIWDKIRV